MIYAELKTQSPMYLRVLLAMLFSLGVTVCLVWGMAGLINTKGLKMPEPTEYKPIDIALVETVIEPVYEKAVEKIPEPEIAPEMPSMMIEEYSGPTVTELTINFEPTPTEVVSGGYIENGRPIAQVMLSPQYPARALVKGLEGYVDVVFDVTKYGATTNIRITGAVPKNIFNRAAKNAVKKWKYSPTTENGEPVVYRDMAHRIQFQMEKKEA